jgi:hypothetical protein
LNETLFEVLFMMVILKIPIVYLCAVVWWAWRAEPTPPEAVRTSAVTPEPEPPAPSWFARRLLGRGPRRPGPHGGLPRRVRRREAVARGRVGS